MFIGVIITRKRLKKGAVPSLFWYKRKQQEKSRRQERYDARSRPVISYCNFKNYCK